MSELKLYHNGESKVLMTTGGRVIKKPYEFGASFQNKMGLNNYIRVRNQNLPQNNCLIIISPLSTSGDIALLSLHNSNNDNYTVYKRGYSSQPLQLIYNSPSTFELTANTLAGATYTGAKMQTVFDTVAPGVGLTYAEGALKSTINNSSVPNAYPITEVWIGASAASNSANPTAYANNKIHSIALFNRSLSLGEVKYQYNNGLGSDFQIITGLELYLMMNMAKILDFSAAQDGSDMRVGCRDYSGFNRHGEIINLPAGTLSEQLSYANSNLFVPFLI